MCLAGISCFAQDENRTPRAANGAHAESKAWLPMSLRPCPPSRCRSIREKAGKGVKTLTNHQDLEAEALLDLFGKHSLSAPMSAS